MIAIEDLTFSYPGKKPVINGLNLHVDGGAIYGFIGANGAGKSTTIRNMLGLLEPRQGKVYIMGKEISTAKLEIMQKTGHLIDAPAFYGHLTCLENLQLLHCYYKFDRSRVEAVLKMTGLWEQRRLLFSKCSTGMKQRLSIARSIIHQPKLLILDEPLNGLDPEWVVAIRNLLKEINQQGTTIFFSSHLLSEMEKLATHVGILKDGHLTLELPMQTLLAQHQQLQVTIFLDRTEQLHTLFNNGHIQVKQTFNDNSATFRLDNKTQLHLLLQTLITNNYRILDLNTDQPGLEEIFLHYNS
ncbi:ABC transporter ATP-binding protein [Chitinophaga agrisoli]|nr:ABC transporter ATP-binding protein [Chitinophaga agrisoli]